MNDGKMTIEEAAQIIITHKNGTRKWSARKIAQAEKIESETER